MLMKTPRFRSLMMSFALASLLLSISLHTSAQPPTGVPAEIKYIGLVNDKLVFEIVYINEEQESLSLQIKDQGGYLFYFERSKEKKFLRRFAIDKTELGKNAITFVLSTKDNIHKQVFDVNASFRVVEEVSVVQQ